VTKRALISGISGQDGSYLAELLLAKGYDVHGMVRRHSVAETQTTRIQHLLGDPRLHLHYGDLTDGAGTARLIRDLEPDEVYNLAAQSHVRVSFDIPAHSFEVASAGLLHILDAAHHLKGKAPRVYQASTSEMFGSSPPPQDEETPLRPRSPYACGKVAAHYLARHYRERGLFVACGILFNHESPRRGENFVTRKVTRAAARIRCGLQEKVHLGNLEARRDWGFAGDYVESMWRMLQADEPNDFVVATGESHSVQELVELVFGMVGMDWREHVELDTGQLRPTEVDHLRGDALRAKVALEWEPTVGFEDLIRMMLGHDMALAREDAGMETLRKQRTKE